MVPRSTRSGTAAVAVAAVLFASSLCPVFAFTSYGTPSGHHHISSVNTPHSTTSLNLFSFGKKSKQSAPVVPAAIQGVGDEGCALPSPSGINTLPESQQAAVFVAYYAALGIGSYLLSNFLGDISLKYEWVQSWRYTWPLLGAIYAAAGVTHFTLEKEYVNIYPAKGAWGFWNLAGSPEFHVKWTGVAELLGGVALMIGGAYDAFAPVYTQFPNVLTPAGIGYDAAAGLFLLTLVVTPANIYMFTHGARLPMEDPANPGEPGPEVPVVGHAIRGVMQVILLALLYQMSDGTFDSIANGTFGCPTC